MHVVVNILANRQSLDPSPDLRHGNLTFPGDTHGVRTAPVRVRPARRASPSIRGAEEVRQLYAATVRRYGDGTSYTKHVTSNVMVQVDEAVATATARSYFTVLQQLEDFPL